MLISAFCACLLHPVAYNSLHNLVPLGTLVKILSRENACHQAFWMHALCPRSPFAKVVPGECTKPWWLWKERAAKSFKIWSSKLERRERVVLKNTQISASNWKWPHLSQHHDESRNEDFRFREDLWIACVAFVAHLVQQRMIQDAGLIGPSSVWLSRALNSKKQCETMRSQIRFQEGVSWTKNIRQSYFQV